MKRILFMVVVMAMFLNGCLASLQMRVTYVMDDNTKFMCEAGVKTEGKDGVTEGKAMCGFKIVKDGSAYECSVAMDKLRKGYKPNIDADCDLYIKK